MSQIEKPIASAIRYTRHDSLRVAHYADGKVQIAGRLIAPDDFEGFCDAIACVADKAYTAGQRAIQRQMLAVLGINDG